MPDLSPVRPLQSKKKALMSKTFTMAFTTALPRPWRLAALTLLTSCTLALAQQPDAPAPGAAPADGVALDGLVRDAMLYAYPYQEFMQMRHSALSDPASTTFTKRNAFRHARQTATSKDRWANGPIVDTLYSTGWLDVGTSPVVLSVPDTAGRYYVVALVGANLDTFAYVGQRASGTAARRIAIVGPDWQGQLPKADQTIRAPTRDVYLNMRVLVDGSKDLDAAHRVQDAVTTVPTRAAVPADEPRLAPERGNWARFVDVANEALARNPPPAREAALLQRYREVGICGAECSWERLSPEVQARWQALAPDIEKELKSALNADRRSAAASRKNGWLPFRLPSTFGSNYRQRAGSAAMSGGILGLEEAEAVYFFASVDGNAQPLGGGARYRLHLPQGTLPADAFWSITLYEFPKDGPPGGHYVMDNPIDRHSIGDRTPGLQRNADGSLDILIQPEDPGPARRSNWLPSPGSNRFVLNARLYQPWPLARDPSWSPEPVEKLTP